MKAKNIKIKKKFDFNQYLAEAIIFFNEKLKKKVIILLIISAVLVIFTMYGTINEIKTLKDILQVSRGFFGTISYKTGVGIITVFAGLVPHIYVPVFGYIAYLYESIKEIALQIYVNGYFLGILKGIVPLVLNVISISIFTAIGIYFCKINTNFFKESQRRNININTVKLSIYDITKNKNKKKKLEEQIKEQSLKSSKIEMKANYKQMFNFVSLAISIQIFSIVIQYIFK